MMKCIFWLVAALFVSFSFAGPKPDSLAKQDRGPMHMNPAKFLKEEIGLSDDQLKKIEAIRLDAEKQTETVRHDMEMEKLSMKEMALKGTLTKDKLKASIKKAEESRAKIHAARFQAAENSIDVFTEDQIKKMAEKRMLGRFLEMGEEKDHHAGKEGGMGREHMEHGE
jgi:hypothetical protein